MVVLSTPSLFPSRQQTDVTVHQTAAPSSVQATAKAMSHQTSLPSSLLTTGHTMSKVKIKMTSSAVHRSTLHHAASESTKVAAAVKSSEDKDFLEQVMDYVQKDKMTVIIIGCGVALVLIAIIFVIIFILMDHAKQKRKKKLKEKMDKEKEERRKKRKAAASHAKKKSSRKSRKRKKEDSSSSSSSHRKRKRQEIEKKKSHDNVKKAVADYLESQLQTCLLAPAQDNETPNMGMSPADADYFATPTPGARPRLGDTPVEVPSSPQNQPPGNAAQNEQRPPVDSVQLGY